MATLRLNQCVVIERSRWIDVLHSRYDVVIAGKDDRHAGLHQFRAVLDQTFEPGQFVIELRTGLRISVRQIDGSDQHTIYRRFDIACLAIFRIPRQARSRQHRIALPRQDRYAVPGTFAYPDPTIAQVTKGTCRKCSLLCLEFLEANDVGLRPCEPRREIVQPLVDVVDVESGDLQWSGLTHKNTPVPSRVSYWNYVVCVASVLR